MKKYNIIMLLMLILLIVSACSSPQEHTTNVDRDRALAGAFDETSNFAEARQIAEIEEWKDQQNKVVNLYIIKPDGGLLIPPVQCKGVPASSTESVEPNEGMSDYWRYSGDDALVPFKENIDGQTIYTYEMPGRDGTYGDPTQYRQCMSYDGHYYDLSAYSGFLVLVTSATYTFPDATVKRDAATELRIKQLEIVLENGGCVDFNRLVEIDCSEQPEIESSEVISQ